MGWRILGGKKGLSAAGRAQSTSDHQPFPVAFIPAVPGMRNVTCTQNIGCHTAFGAAKRFGFVALAEIKEQYWRSVGRRHQGWGSKNRSVRAARPPGSTGCEAPRNSLAMPSGNDVQPKVE